MNFTVIGTTDEQTVCDRCGKVELKMTVVLRDDEGEIVKFGRTCAARVTGRKVSILDREIIAANNKVGFARELLARYEQYRGHGGTELFIQRNPHVYKHNTSFGDITRMIEDTIAKYEAELAPLALVAA